MKRISAPFESLIQSRRAGATLLEVEYLVIGSGYGGAVAAVRLAHAGSPANPARREVVVLERGREYALGEFPYDLEDLPSHLRLLRDGHEARGYASALAHFYTGSTGPEGAPRATADILVGSGIGGTSLINANVAETPQPHVFRKPRWPREIREAQDPLAAEFAAVARHIGVTTRAGNAEGPFPKHTALQRLGRALGAPAQPAHIAVSTEAASNGVGVRQSPCTDCGNCVTGCNVGAKNTLDRNLLRLAKSRGARLFNGATVLRIERDTAGTHRWQVIVQATTQPQGTVTPQTYRIRANHVVLAAGALGSTEILLRSRNPDTLPLSDRLGENFSTNGDGLIMSYGQRQAVGAIAGAAQKDPVKRPGPSITGIIRTGAVSIEDASIPAALARLFPELVTSSAMLQRLVNRELPAVFSTADHDPLAASMDVAEHCQALLVMGDDGADGQLSLHADSDRLRIAFPKSNIGDNAALRTANELVKAQDRGAGLDGGQYAPNPLWELLPPDARAILGNQLPAGRVITVHPLGGCAMGDDVGTGVVDHRGRVFNADGGVHDGLYVLDGAAIPAALEVNPFLTIAALAWRNAGLILDAAPESDLAAVLPQYADLGCVPDRPRARPLPTAFVIQEQLTGQLTALTPWFRQHLGSADQQRLTDPDGLVVQIRSAHADAEDWLRNPGAQPLTAIMQLYVNPLPAAAIRQFHPVGVDPAHMRELQPFMTLQGSFSILRQAPHSPRQDCLGGLRAIWTYIRRRGWAAITLPGKAAGPRERVREGLRERVREGLRGLRIFFNIGVLQSRFRSLSYTFHEPASGLSIRGAKVLGYSDKLARMWPALLNLTLSVREASGATGTARLTVNPEFLLDPGLVEITRSAHLPQSLLFTGGLAAFFARALLATNVWEFAGLEYPLHPIARPSPTRLTPTGGKPVEPSFRQLDVPVSARSDATCTLLLTRYRRDGAKPVLLLHGLAQSSQIFWTDSINNLATCFYDAGYEVWLLDYRLSPRVLPTLHDVDWSMDEIAKFDIPLAIEAVCRESGHEQILVFGHCVGACTLAMAALADATVGKRIEAAITNAIHPWVIGSRANRFRAKFGSFYREWVSDTQLDPMPMGNTVGTVQNLLDRIAYGLARIGEQDMDPHEAYGGSALAQSICDRMTFLYGRMWNHRHLAAQTHQEFAQMLGPAPARTYQQLYYYNSLRRLTDRHGENAYLTADRIRENWTFPILFVHGGDSRVFNPYSAIHSARQLRKTLAPGRPDVTQAIHHEVFAGYGHMDVVFGKHAHAQCFPRYVEFFRDPRAYQSRDSMELPEHNLARPYLGPILRAAWIDDGRLHLRLWAELRMNVTAPPRRLIANDNPAGTDFEIAAPGPEVLPGRFRLIDVEIADIHAPIALELRGDVPDYHRYRGAQVRYDQQAWLLRLRAAAAGRRDDRLGFVVGSCRFPGSLVDNALSDRIFTAIADHITDADNAQLLFLIGDQIYADATDQLFEVNTPKSRYTERYRRAFGGESSPAFAALAQQIPTHFALDDHEVDDNCSGLPADATAAQRHRQAYALRSAARFMASGRHQVPLLAGHAPTPSPFYYPLAWPQECAFPMFVMDTRSERDFRQDDDPGAYRLFDDTQYQALTHWLQDAHRRDASAPKFILSGSTIAPLPDRYCAEPSTWRQLDGWAGYPRSLETLLAFIVRGEIRNVVFVGGDAHFSAVATLNLTLPATPGRAGTHVVVHQVVSSGLYAPLPFANSHAEDFTWRQPVTLPMHLGTGLQVTCTNTLLSDGYQQFVRVDVDRQQLTVACYDVNRQLLAREQLPLAP